MKNILTLLVPSTRAASYRSAGMFIRIPDVISIVYGIPSHILIMITTALARFGLPVGVLPKKSMALEVICKFTKMVLTGPFASSKFLITNREMN